jgi:hypothetical protein
MQLTVAAWDDRVFPVELDANEPFATLMAILEAESGLPAAQQQLQHNGRPVPPSAHGQGLTALGIADGDVLMLMPLQQQGGAGQGQQQRTGAGVCVWGGVVRLDVQKAAVPASAYVIAQGRQSLCAKLLCRASQWTQLPGS